MLTHTPTGQTFQINHERGRTDSNRVSKFWRLLLLPGSRPQSSGLKQI